MLHKAYRGHTAGQCSWTCVKGRILWHAKVLGCRISLSGLTNILPVGITGVPEAWQFWEEFFGSDSGVTLLFLDKFEVKEGRPCRAEKRASSRLADKRCSWELQLGAEEMWWNNTLDNSEERKTPKDLFEDLTLREHIILTGNCIKSWSFCLR